MRKRSISNIRQISNTIQQLKDEELKDFANWCTKLPLYIENDNFRVVHACWDEKAIRFLNEIFPSNKLNLDVLKSDYIKNSNLYNAIEVTLKGPEVALKNNHSFIDNYGKKRTEVRVAWWSREQLVAGNDDIRSKINPSDIEYKFYDKSDKLVFFGHYWLPFKEPKIISPNAICLDYSVAKEGILVSYRYNGEKQVILENFVY